jgi:tetratricopeptide (TPR) repeat protein
MDLFETIIDTLPKGDTKDLHLSNLPSEEEIAQVFLDCCNDLPGAVTVRYSYKNYQKMVRLDRKNSQRRRKDGTPINYEESIDLPNTSAVSQARKSTPDRTVPREIRSLSNMREDVLLLRGHGELEEAEKLQRKILEFQVDDLGARHPETISAMSALSIIIHDWGRLEETEKMQRDILMLQEEIFGAQDPSTISTMYDLSTTLRSLGQLEEAEEMQRTVLALQKDILGAEHPDTILTMRNLSITLNKRGQLEEAKKM